MARTCFLFFIAVFLFSSPAMAQVTIQFIPEVYGRSVDGLFNCRIFNPNKQQQQATLTITVTERKGGTLCIIKTEPFNVVPGNNPIPPSAARTARIQYGSSKLGRLTSLRHNFPEGDYEYCYDISFVHSDNPPDEQCFNYVLAPFADLSLIGPDNRDSICERRPLFTWQPLIPGVAGSYYQLVLTEIKKGQNATEALNYNLPIINQNNIISPILPYPSIVPDLEKGKKYAWQVTAYKDQTILNRSEIWQFVVHCPDTLKKILRNGFRDIEDLLRGNYYIAYGSLKFALVNSYRPQKLKYEIIPVIHPDKPIGHLPKIKLDPGGNNILIDLRTRSGFKDGEYYLLNITLPNGQVKSLRFIYKEPNEDED